MADAESFEQMPFRASPELMQLLRECAARYGRSVAEELRIAVELHVTTSAIHELARIDVRHNRGGEAVTNPPGVAADTQSERLRRQLVQALRRNGWIRSAAVRDAFLQVPREMFVPEFTEREGLAAVYRDESILTKRNEHGVPLSSSSQPAIMALMLEQLHLAEGMQVLEVGAGTGYNAALLSVLVGRHGRVVSVDVDPEVARSARQALRKAGSRARVVVGDGREGFAGASPYDRIVVTASSDSVPIAWFDQLKPDGILQVPLRLSASGAQAIPLLRKQGPRFRSTQVIVGGFMPLRSPGEDAAAALKRPALVVSDATGE